MLKYTSLFYCKNMEVISMIGIYKFTNKVNGMAYVGQSSNIQKRYNQHKNVDHEFTLFHDAIKEFGFDSFDFEVIETCQKTN